MRQKKIASTRGSARGWDGPRVVATVGGLNRKIAGSVVQSGRVSGGPPRGSYHFLHQNSLMYRGGGRAPSCGVRSLGKRVVATGHWEGGLNRKITGSVVQSSCVSGGPPRG